MITNLTQSQFLLWRQPGEDKYTVYTLSDTVFSPEEFVVCPFVGQPTHFGIVGVKHIALSDLPFVSYPRIEVDMPAVGKKEGEHVAQVTEAVRELRKGPLQKVVLTRALCMATHVNAGAWYLALADAYPNSCVFAFFTHKTGFWMGATPERLLEAEHGKATSVSLAGTRAAGTKGAWGNKEVDEQAMVTRSISQCFGHFGMQGIRISQPKTEQAGPVEHIKNEVTGYFKEGQNALDLAMNLHPTPAVGGLPKKDALVYITHHEGYNRSYYTGFFGINGAQKASFWVNLRCMQLFGNGVVLYAGGGITPASVPQAEWDETCKKMLTLTAIIKHE